MENSTAKETIGGPQWLTTTDWEPKQVIYSNGVTDIQAKSKKDPESVVKTRIFVYHVSEDLWHVFEQDGKCQRNIMGVFARADSSLITTRCGASITGEVKTSEDKQYPLCKACGKGLMAKKDGKY